MGTLGEPLPKSLGGFRRSVGTRYAKRAKACIARDFIQSFP
jgi:hypothetical protein